MPAPIWLLAEHLSFGQNGCDGSIGSVLVVFLFTASDGRTIFPIPPNLFTGSWGRPRYDTTTKDEMFFLGKSQVEKVHCC